MTRTTCPYCGVGCGVLALPDNSAAGATEGAGASNADGKPGIRIKADPVHPANLGRLCSKGAALADTLTLDGRVLTPRMSGRSATWGAALNRVAEAFGQAVTQHGPDSVAMYVSGQILTEDYYVANKLMKGYIGTANIDTNSRLCMASSVAGHKRAFGADTVPGQYEDLEQADLVVLVGSNLAWCHPVLYQRLATAKQNRPDMRVVVIDPRRTMSADLADLHLPVRPDGDIALFNGLLSALQQAQCIDQDFVDRHVNGFDAAVAQASQLDLADIAAHTGLAETDITAFYDWFVSTEKVVTVYSQGVNQSSCGSDKVNAIINCHLATGRIGRPGMGPFSVTGQPNAMGGREVGGLANMLAAHMELANPAHQEIVQEFWQSPRIASKPGLKAVDLFDAVASGQIKALWIMATNPVDSMPDAARVEAAIRSCPFVVVSDVQALTDTTRHADVLLPSAAWSEKDGTVTNSERRISRQRGFRAPPGEARSDWWQVCQVAQRMGFTDAFNFSSPAEIFREHAALSACQNNGTRDFDIGACADLSDAEYNNLEPFVWPWRAGERAAPSRFFASGGFFTADGRANMLAVELPAPARSNGESDRTLTLNTGRIRDQWHTMTRTGGSARLSAHLAEPFAELHPLDAATRGIGAADLVQVTSSPDHAPGADINGANAAPTIVARALITDRQQPGSVFVPMHFTDQVASNARVDKLISARTDPLSGQPASKSMPVQVTRYHAKAYGFVVSRVRPEPASADYWAMAPAVGGWRLELVLREPLSALHAWLEDLLGIRGCEQPIHRVEYVDAARGLNRYAWLDHAQQLVAIAFFATDPVAVSRSWAVSCLGQTHQRNDVHRLLAARAGDDVPDAGALVCSCMNVGRLDIERAIAAGNRDVNAVGDACRAGTSCGSCRAEIQGIIEEYQVELSTAE